MVGALCFVLAALLLAGSALGLGSSGRTQRNALRAVSTTPTSHRRGATRPSGPYASRLGSGNLTPKIMGGKEAYVGQFPELVSVRMNVLENVNIHFCGGVIIDPHWILTAGHCLQQTDPELLSITAGAVHLLSPYAYTSWIGSYEIHEDFDRPSVPGRGPLNDIALIRMNDSIPFGKNIRAAKMEGITPQDGDPLTIAGFGYVKTHQQLGDPTVQLMYTDVEFISNTRCKCMFFTNVTIVEDPDVCVWNSGDIDTGGMSGDSGGPLYANGTVIGLSSWSRVSLNGRFPDIYTDVSKYFDWIEEKTTLKFGSGGGWWG